MNDVPAWAPISQLFPLFRSETLKWSVDSTFCSSHRPSLSDRLDGSTPEKSSPKFGLWVVVLLDWYLIELR